MTIKHRCGKKIVSNKAITETHTKKHYDEYASMHYDDCNDGWSSYTVITYIVKKCNNCKKEHKLDEHQIL